MSIIEPTPVEERLMALSGVKQIEVTEREKIIISGMDELFASEKDGSITTLVPVKERYKIVSSKNYRRESFVLRGAPEVYNGYWIWLKDELESYQRYLDYLYQNNVEEVSEADINLVEFEALVKALMIKYDLSVVTRPDEEKGCPVEGEITKVGTDNYASFIIFNSNLIRSSFNASLLSTVKNKMSNINDAKNSPSLEMLYRYFLENPRPQMKVKSYRND